MPGQTPILKLPYPVPDDTVDVPRDVKALADKLDTVGTVPVGAMMMWPGAVAPVGWLFCQGQTNLPAATYPGLATLLGQTGGMVNMPDYRDVFPVGAGPTMALGSRGGAASVALSMAQMPNHSHRSDGNGGSGGYTGTRDRSQSHGHTIGGQMWVADIAGGYWMAGAGNRQGNVQGNGTEGTDPADHLHGIYANGGNGAHENRPPYQAINFIIRAG